MSEKAIAVLLSSYNGEKYIGEQINSILNQEINECELFLIIRDDGSTDSTVGTLEKYAASNPNISIIKGENKGLVASFFELLSYAREADYDFYAFSDQDDYWCQGKLRIAIDSLREKEEPCMYASCSEVADMALNATGKTTQKKHRDITFYNSAIQNFCPGHNQVLNKALADFVLKNTVYEKDIYSQDLWITNVAALTGEIIFDNTPHTLYRQHINNQLSYGKGKLGWIKDHINRLKKQEGKKITTQLECFSRQYKDYLSEEQENEIRRFVEARHNFASRVKYIAGTKLYRQKSSETIIFKLLYIFGGY